MTGPVAFTVGPGEMELVDWQAAGLPNHSGGVRYRRRIGRRASSGSSSARSAGRPRCSSTARAPACASAHRTRSTSPSRIGPDGATLEILVLNTLGPHLDAVSPTPYVFEGQRRSGLFGPVRVLRW